MKKSQEKIQKAKIFIENHHINKQEVGLYEDKNLLLGKSLETIILSKKSGSLKKIINFFKILKEIELSDKEINKLEIMLLYKGYIETQEQQIKATKKLESKLIPKNFNYEKINGIISEAKEKLKKYKPENIAQASKIPGVNPTDIFLLLIHLKKLK